MSTQDPTKTPHDQEAAQLTDDDLETVTGGADDRPTEEVAFYYNKIAFNYAHTKDGKS